MNPESPYLGLTLHDVLRAAASKNSDRTALKAFLDEMGGEMIIKPLDGCGGAGPRDCGSSRDRKSVV